MVVVDNNKDALVFGVVEVRKKETRVISKGTSLHPMASAGKQTVESNWRPDYARRLAAEVSR